MAITGPSELPYILKVDSDPLKKYVLSKLGHPVIEVEVTEDQWETVLRTTGNFIAHYFSKEQMLAVFNTQPLAAEYDLPKDAYWIQEVSWDPVTTKIDQIFGAESFLFCFGPGTKILRSDGELILIEDWQDDYKAKTPFGDKKIQIEEHKKEQPLLEIIHEHGSLLVTPNHPLKVDGCEDMLNGWIPAEECVVGSKLIDNHGLSEVLKIEQTSGPTHSTISPGSHCLYVSKDGNPILAS